MHKKTLNELKSSDKSIGKIIELSALFLTNQGIENAKNEIRWYIQKLCNFNSAELYSLQNKKISNESFEQIIDFLTQRSNNIPFQHLLGYAPFYGRDFMVDSNVLIPRQESEILIDIIKQKRQSRVLDIGTGSGCLAITAFLEGVASRVDAIDINQNAIDLAKKNSEALNVSDINYIKMNILDDTPGDSYDIVISNPPYISKNEYKDLDIHVRGNEPLEALTDMSDGYTFYRRYAFILKKILNKSGFAVFELSQFFNKQKISSIFKDFSNIKFYKDINNNLRAVKISND